MFVNFSTFHRSNFHTYICPKSYYQLFTVHGIYFYQIIPLVYALLIGKETNDYNKFFEQLLLKHDYEPESILVDFENATLNSTKKMFADAIQLGNFKLYAFFNKTECCYESRLFFSILDNVYGVKYNH